MEDRYVTAITWRIRTKQSLGDVGYVGQHDDDIEDLVKWIRLREPSLLTLIITGHSGGGGNAVRLAASRILSNEGTFQEVESWLQSLN
jgi:hypothetical protein